MGIHSYYAEIMSKSKYSATGNKGLAGLEKANKVILDVDTGGDDGQAIVLAHYLSKKLGEIEIIGITTVAGNAVLE